MQHRLKWNVAVKTVFIALIAALFVLPLIWMISASLKRPLDVFKFPIEWIPKNPRWQNYTEVWTNKDAPFTRLYINSIIIAVATLIGRILSSSLAAYAFAKLEFDGKNIVFMLLLCTMMIPSQVTVIPRFLMFKSIGLYNNLWAVILPDWFSVTAIFLLRQFYHGLPNDLVEAAKVDGAGHLRIWGQIMLPLTKPAIVSLSILGFVSVWNDYMGPLIFLVRKDLYTVSLGIRYWLLGEASAYNLSMAASTSAVIPVLILFVCCQKYFIEGIATSGMKE